MCNLGTIHLQKVDKYQEQIKINVENDSRKLAACNAIRGLSHSLCAAVSLPEGSVFRLEWPETALVYTRSEN